MEAVHPQQHVRDEVRWIPKPRWAVRLEASLGRGLALSANSISLLKLLLLLPLWWLARAPSAHPISILLCFASFAALDYLDGVVAREKGQASRLGAVLDRITDLPFFLICSLYWLGAIPRELWLAKIAIDALLAVLFLRGAVHVENRLRTALSYAAVITALAGAITPFGPGLGLLAATFLLANMGLSTLVALRKTNLIRKHYLADALSASNLLSGVAGMLCAHHGRFDLAAVWLCIGLLCDGLDGAAARKFGGTRWGVYSDDIADAVHFGIAPGYALGQAIGGPLGLALAIALPLFVFTRLIHFTRTKGKIEPGRFAGAPSTLAPAVVFSSLALAVPTAIVTAIVCLVCVLMVSFRLRFRHWGQDPPRKLIAAVWPAVALYVLTALGCGVFAPAMLTLLLGGALLYLITPLVALAA